MPVPLTGDGVLLRQGPGGLVVRLTGDGDFHRLCDRLEAQLSGAGPALAGGAITIDVGSRLLTTREMLEMESIVNRHAGVRLVQVIDSSGHPWAPEGHAPGPKGTPARTWTEEAMTTAPVEDVAHLVRRTVRSGQRVVSSGHVVVLGDVNPGGEVVAAGDIVVMGTLRGLAHAGALGDERAVIAALRLEPMQIRIAQQIGRAPDGDGPAGPGPEVARVRDGVITIES